jgi:hypothetical protein
MLSQQFELIDLGSCMDLWHTVPLRNICERSPNLGLSGFLWSFQTAQRKEDSKIKPTMGNPGPG